MKIIFEGADKTGKSTLAANLAKQLKWPLFHAPRADGNIAWNDQVKRETFYQAVNLTVLEVFKTFDNFICDRFFISDAVYSKLFNREQNLSEHNIMRIEGKVLVILTHCSTEKRLERLNDAGDDHEDQSEFDIHVEGTLFKEYVAFYQKQFPKNFNFLVLDTGKYDEKTCMVIIKDAIKYFEKEKIVVMP